MDRIDALRAETDGWLHAEGEVLNAEMADERGGVAVAEAERAEAGSEVTDRSDSRLEGTEDLVGIGLPALTEDALVPAGEGQGDGVPDPSGQPAPAGTFPDEERRAAQAITFVNGAKFCLGELLPWKGVQFQVIHVNGGSVALHGIGLTDAEMKRIMKRRAHA